MMQKRMVLTCCCVALLALAGCSRQQSDWQKTREANTAEAYEQFLKKYPSGEFAGQAQARVKELYEERDWQKARDADTPEAYQAFLKQYPEGKWMEEARIRIENFTLAQAPTGASPTTGGAPPAAAESAAAVAPVPAPAPTPAPRAASVKPAPKHAGKHASGASAAAPAAHYAVQLGAFKSGPAAATQRWQRLQKQYPKLLAGLTTKVLPKKSGEGHLYRLQAVGLTAQHAQAICKSLRAKSQACVVVGSPE